MPQVVIAVLLPMAAYQLTLPANCSDVYKAGLGDSGVSTRRVIQRRQDGTVNFYMTWDHYKAGFGSAAGDYWLGLERMHLLTQAKNYELRVDMKAFDGAEAFAQYSSFSVGPETDGYRLVLGSFAKGTAGDALTMHNGQKFTTTDKDQDAHVSNSARLMYREFWYAACCVPEDSL